MLPISKIDSQLNIYKDKLIVIWGIIELSENIFNLLKGLNINVDYFCIENCLENEINGIPLIAPNEVSKIETNNEIIIQLAVDSNNEISMKSLIKEIGFNNIISYEEAFQILLYYTKCRKFREQPQLMEFKNKLGVPTHYQKQCRLLDSYIGIKDQFDIYICMIGKTGDTTLLNTLSKYNVNTTFVHYPSTLNLNYFPKNEKIKIITAIREPIGRTFSGVFNSISKLGTSLLRDDFYDNELNDIQSFFDLSLSDSEEIQKYTCERVDLNYKKEFINLTRVEIFFQSFKENIVDLLQYPFDKHIGYSIIKENNVEVFVYQLEKLNDIIPQLSKWIGIEFDTLENSNITANKWCADSYIKAQKEIKFSKEFFDKSYNDPYIKHFYHQSDIDMFKKKWRNNIDYTNETY